MYLVILAVVVVPTLLILWQKAKMANTSLHYSDRGFGWQSLLKHEYWESRVGGGKQKWDFKVVGNLLAPMNLYARIFMRFAYLMDIKGSGYGLP